LWCSGGNNRAVARQAFADVLPSAIIDRRGKGSPDSFVIEIFEANRGALQALLEDGLLASHGLLDSDRVRAVLADTAPVRGSAYGRVMQLADVEAWARSWTERRPPR
jgi:asparagine synthase (glutamine-hydrolysing)